MDTQPGSVALYHPRGPLVVLPVLMEPKDAKAVYDAIFANVSVALDAGWLATAPGLEAGEQRSEIGYVVRREKENDDQSLTPLIDLYPADEQLKFAVLSVYLNDDAAISAFEFAARVRLTDLPTYIGSNKIERGASRQTDKYVVAVPKAFGVVWKDNPKHDPNEQDTKKKKPKRLFVRWTDQKLAPATKAEPAIDERLKSEIKSMDGEGTLPGLEHVWKDIAEAIRKGLYTDEEKDFLVAHKDKRKAAILAPKK